MSACLDDARIQAVADGEGAPADVEHSRTCRTCAERVAQARAAVAQFSQAMGEVNVPPMLGARVSSTAAHAAARRGGATTLRTQPARRPAWVVAGLGAAAAVLAFVFVLLPSFDPATRLSAAEILDRSLQSLSASGAERLRYELTIDAPSAADAGTFVIEQLIDHQTGRWRLARFAPDGALLNGVAENPRAQTREAIINVDGQTFRFQFDISAGERLALWQLQRRYAEAMLRTVKASGAQVVSTEPGPDGERYVVDVPATDRPAPSAPFDLARARVIVDASDYHIVELTAAGAVMGEPVSVGYRLMQRDLLGGEIPETEFSLSPAGPEVIELKGDGSNALPRDILSLLLKEVAQSRR